MTECAESAETPARGSSAEWPTDAWAEPSCSLEPRRRQKTAAKSRAAVRRGTDDSRSGGRNRG